MSMNSTVKLFNETTGLFYRKGHHFTEEKMCQATPLNPAEAAVVRASYDGAIGSIPVGCLSDACDCDECEEET